MFRVPTADIYIYSTISSEKDGERGGSRRKYCHRDCEADSERKFVRMSPDNLAQSLAQYLANCNCICMPSVCLSVCLSVSLSVCRSYCWLCVVFVFAVVALMCFLYKVMSIGQQTCCRQSACVWVRVCPCVCVYSSGISNNLSANWTPPPPPPFPCGTPQIALCVAAPWLDNFMKNQKHDK